METAKKPENKDEKFFVVIDEINRGNLSKIFGELLMLIEADKRGPDHSMTLAYSDEKDEKFFVPENIYIIGTMNTADKSISNIDYALRRRFSFFSVEPAFNTEKFNKFLKDKKIAEIEIQKINNRMNALNELILNDKSLGKGFEVGHSYFCSLDSDKSIPIQVERIIKYDIHDLLKQYWHDDEDQLDSALEKLKAA